MHIYDIIHGYMPFNERERKVIDSKWMKRLKRIKQLGMLEHVFPSASHNRFEHSLGVSHLAGHYINILSNDAFKPSDTDILSVRIAALLHDVGHGPFSHIFDTIIDKDKQHEHRSQKIVERIFKEIGTSKNFSSAYIIDSVKEMIEPTQDLKNPLNSIVNNRITKIDVDKFDYLLRDPQHIGISANCDYERIFIKSRISRNEIIYDYSVLNNILELYMTRYRFHKEIYNHKTVKIIEIMLRDALLAADNVYNFRDWVSDERFLKLDDSIYSTILNSNSKDLTEARNILKRIERRDLYRLLWTGSKDDAESIDIDETSQRIDLNFNLCNGNKFPLEKVKFIKGDIIQTGDKFNLNMLYPSIYEDETVMIYSL